MYISKNNPQLGCTSQAIQRYKCPVELNEFKNCKCNLLTKVNYKGNKNILNLCCNFFLKSLTTKE